MAPSTDIFATFAPDLHKAGLAILPLAAGDDDEQGQKAGKKPLVTGFQRWNFRPSHRSVDQWCHQFPAMNIGYVPGLSDPPIIVVDDDGGAEEAIAELFGRTPGRIATRRASHHLYRAPRGDMPAVVDLKRFGINADLKHGNTIVVAPPSVHKSGHVYAWQDCGPDVLKELPPFPLDHLKRLIDRQRDLTQTERKAIAGYRGGSRKLALNDRLCGQASWCDTLAELLDLARTWNEQQPAAGIEKLDEKEMMQIAQSVWTDCETGKVERWHRRPARVRSSLTEFNELMAVSKDGALAYALLMKLRGEHGGRMARGETFALNQIAMAEAGTIPHWTRYDYEKARDVLLAAGKLKIASAGKNSANGRISTQYRLAEGQEPTVTT
jgi:hypothetical protein